MSQDYYPQEDLSKLSKKEIDEKMSAISTQTTSAHGKMVNAKDDSEKVSAQGVYKALTDEYDRLKAEYDKRVSS